MKTVMQFLKNHWITLVSGLVAVGGIAMAAYGMTQDDVQKALDSRVQAASRMDSLQKEPTNKECIDAEKLAGSAFKTAYDDAVKAAEDINRRAPLLENVFPELPPEQSQLAYRFRETYENKVYELPRILGAGTPPTAIEIQEAEEELREKELERLRQEGELVDDGTPTGGARGTTVNIEATDSRRLAAVRKARSIRLYADLVEGQTSFHVSPMFSSVDPPSMLDMWFGQVSYWVQRDIVDAIKEVNDAAAAKLNESEVHVATMPVKRLVNTQVYGYINKDEEQIPFPRQLKTGTTTAAPLSSFTGRKTDEQFDIVRFGVTIVADQRDVLDVIDAITRKNFYQCVGFQSQIVAPEKEGDLYYYGDEPVVQATLEFEGYLARKVYEEMMPTDVRIVLGIMEAQANR